MAKGRRTEWGTCTHEIKTSTPEAMYEAVIHAAGIAGLSKAEWQRDLLGERLYGRLEFMTGRPSVVRQSDERRSITVDVLPDTRDHLAALAFLEGVTVEEFLVDLINQHLYGFHGSKIGGTDTQANGAVRAG